MDAMWQTTAYWIIGATSNDLRMLAHMMMTGFCASPVRVGMSPRLTSAADKSTQISIQCASGAVHGASTQSRPYMTVMLSTWALLAAGLVSRQPMLYPRIETHTEYDKEVLVRMDESGNLRPASEYVPSHRMSDRDKLDKPCEL